MVLMGAGDDTFVWDPGDGSDTVEGQAGADTLLFNGSRRQRDHRRVGQRPTRCGSPATSPAS